MLGRHDDARMNPRAWHAGSDAGEVDNKFRRGMGDDGEIRINSLGFFLAEFEL